MRHSARHTFALLASLAALGLALSSCKVEENLAINPDGSGTYRARVSVEKQFGDAMQEALADAEKDGFTVVEKGETSGERYIVLSREFKEVSELNDDTDRYSLVIDHPTAFKATYHLKLDFRGNPSASGFTRSMKVQMPTTISEASTGSTRGRSVTWDCSTPGTLEIRSAGLVLPITSAQRNQALAVLIIGLLALVGVRIASHRKRARRLGYGAPVE